MLIMGTVRRASADGQVALLIQTELNLIEGWRGPGKHGLRNIFHRRKT